MNARRRLAALLVVAVAIGPRPAGAQESETRADLLRREREDKSRRLEPPDPGTLERLLLDLEAGRLFERLLNPAQGFYPALGNITPGSGFALGPGYRQPGLFGGHADFTIQAMGSLQKYWKIETRLSLLRLARRPLSLDLHAQRYDFPDEDFFGLGPDSLRSNEVTYGLRDTTVGVTGGVHPARWLSFSGGLAYLTPKVAATGREGDISRRFTDAEAPGLVAQPDFIRYEASAAVNTRQPRPHPRRGGRYLFTYQHYADREDGRYSFNRVEADVQHYVSLLRERRILALRAFASVSDADDGAQVPFYLQRTLGGPDDLRGFRRFRFRDRHVLLLQAEYRWEIFTAVDGAIFYDAGKVAPRIEDLNFTDLESDYGIGFRFGSNKGVFLRVEGAFGSSGGTHFILRFGDVF